MPHGAHGADSSLGQQLGQELGRLWRERANMLHMREAAAKVLVLVILLWIYGNTSSAIKMTHARACMSSKGHGSRGGGTPCRLYRRRWGRRHSRLQLHMFTRIIDWQHEHSDTFALLLPLPLSLATPGRLWPN